MPPDSAAPRGLAARGVAKSYGPVQALRDASVEMRPGEISGLVGDNGAGKCTFVKILAGVLDPDAGTLEIDGSEQAFFRSARDAQQAGVMTVYQDLALVEPLTAVENMFLGQELCRGPFRRKREMLQVARELTAQNWVSTCQIRVSESSACPAANARESRLPAPCTGTPSHPLLDEPTAATGVRETGEIIRLVRNLRERGTGILLISHDIPLVTELCDRVFVLRHGRLVKVFEKGVSIDELVLAIAR